MLMFDYVWCDSWFDLNAHYFNIADSICDGHVLHVFCSYRLRDQVSSNSRFCPQWHRGTIKKPNKREQEHPPPGECTVSVQLSITCVYSLVRNDGMAPVWMWVMNKWWVETWWVWVFRILQLYCNLILKSNFVFWWGTVYWMLVLKISSGRNFKLRLFTDK